MKRVGIITLYHENSNYGGLLQSYALRKVIGELGYECEQICYDINSSIIKRIVNAIKNEVKKLIYGKLYRQYLRRIKAVKKFELKIPHTKVVTDKKLSLLNKQFDAFVCGSDQIWNPIGWRSAYFLSFADKTKRKISYAASIARDSLDQDEATFLIQHIRDFYAISLRESECIESINKIDGSLHIITMPDPTLLVKKDEWADFVKDSDENDPYVFAYFLGGNEEYMEAAISYAKKKELNIRFIGGLRYKNCKWEKKNQSFMKQEVDVPGFLSLIQNAQIVITDSFHGAVFSIIFERPFVILNRFQNEDRFSMNSRTWNLMKMMKLNRIVNNLDFESDYHYTESEIESIRAGIKYQRAKGISFLSQSLRGI